MTSNTVSIVVFSGGWKCPSKIHFNKQSPPLPHFGRSVNPIPTGGQIVVLTIILLPPRFSDLPMALNLPKSEGVIPPPPPDSTGPEKETW